MDLSSNQINHGEKSHKKLKKAKQKIPDAMPECTLPSDDVFADDNAELQAKGKLKKKRFKKKEKLGKGTEVNEVGFDDGKIQCNEEKERILTDTLDSGEDKIAQDSTKVDYSSSPKRKKKRLVEDITSRGDKVDEEISTDSKIFKRKKKHHVENTVGVMEDNTCDRSLVHELPFDDRADMKVGHKIKVDGIKEGTYICNSGHLENCGAEEVGKDVRKKKKSKKNKLENDFSSEVDVVFKEKVVDKEVSRKKKKNTRSVHDFTQEATLCAEVQELSDDTLFKEKEEKNTLLNEEPVMYAIFSKKNEKKRKLENNSVNDQGYGEAEEEPIKHKISSKKKKRKLENDSLVEGTDYSAVKLNEEVLEDNLHHGKKKRKKESCSSRVQEEIDTLHNIKKNIPFEENFSQDCEKTHESSAAEGNYTENFTPDDCGKEQQKKTSRNKMSVNKNYKTKCSFSSCSVNQVTNLKKPWDEIKINIPSKQQDRMTWHNERRIAPKQWERSKYITITPQNVDDWQPMVFQFDYHPNVRHYIPRKLMAMNGIPQQLGEVEKLDLKIPHVIFKGSSLDVIPGYGYGV